MPLTDLAPTLSRRLLAGVLVCAFAVPAPAFGQGAGDDQYKDPFPETTAQDAQADTPTETTGDGLSDTPPTSGTTTDSSSSGASTDTSDTGSTSSESSDDAATGSSELAQTGDDPWLIALAGGSLLLLGAGLRLRGGAHRRH